MKDINENKNSIKLLERKIKQLELKLKKLNIEKNKKLIEDNENKKPIISEINEKLNLENNKFNKIKTKEKLCIAGVGLCGFTSFALLIISSVIWPFIIASISLLLISSGVFCYVGIKLEKSKDKIAKELSKINVEKFNLENCESEELRNINKEIKTCELETIKILKELKTLKDYEELKLNKQNLKKKIKNKSTHKNNKELTK